jgi:hypothetical protein
MNDELGKMWKQVAMAYLKALFNHLPAGTAKNHENPSHDICPLG